MKEQTAPELYSEEELEAIKTFFDYFFEDERYSAWVEMEGFLPATKTGGEALAAKDESLAQWIDIVASCKFYPTAKTEWADVKQGLFPYGAISACKLSSSS